MNNEQCWNLLKWTIVKYDSYYYNKSYIIHSQFLIINCVYVSVYYLMVI